MDLDNQISLDHGVLHLAKSFGHVTGKPVDGTYLGEVEGTAELVGQLSPLGAAAAG